MTRNVENMGGLINAATSKEYTCFYIDIQKDGYIEAIKMLADTVTYPLFPAEELEQERKVVVEEIQRHKDNPQSQLFEYFMENLYKDSDYKNSIIGSSDVIKNIPRDEIISYFKTHYIPQNMVVSIVGDIDTNEVSKVIEATFGKIEKAVAPIEPVIIESLKDTVNFTTKDKTVHTYLLAGFLGPDMSSKDIYIADVALNILGSGKSSRLYRVLKEEKNIVFSISSSFMTLRGTGSAYIVAVFEQSKYDEVVANIESELEKFKNEGPTKTELQKIKTNIKSSWLFGLQTFSEQASQLGYWQLQGYPEIFQNYLENIDKVTVTDVKKFMNKYYSKEKLSKVSICPK
jgi:zinc protease